MHCIGTTLKGLNSLDKKVFSGNMALKIDIRKAFDTMEWGFIDVVLAAFGFD